MHQRQAIALTTACLLVALASAARAQDEDQGIYFDEGFEATFVNFQPRLQTPSGAVAAESSARSRTQARSVSSYVRLARAPNMFGDWFNSIGQVVATTLQTEQTFMSDLPQAGGRIPKIGENNKPIPTDRVFFSYNGFQNAVTFGPVIGGVAAREEVNLNRYTLGLEKTFNEGDSSIELRLPLTNGFEFDTGTFALDSGNVGNLSLLLKHLVYEDEIFASAIGLGLVTPTGSDLEGHFGSAPFVVSNEAYHLLPYIGVMATPNTDWFAMAFLQLDFAANGNDVRFGPGGTRAVHTEQNLFFADVSVGRWLYENESVDYFRGVAGIVELHYTSTMQDSDTLTVLSASGLPDPAFAILRNPANRFDVLNLTAGLHFQVTELSDLRIGVVAPLRPGSNRQFDSEIQVSFNRYF